MDYANGTELWKYQWDLIHNPETILLGAYNEEEGAFRNDNQKIQQVMRLIRYSIATGTEVAIDLGRANLIANTSVDFAIGTYKFQTFAIDGSKTEPIKLKFNKDSFSESFTSIGSDSYFKLSNAHFSITVNANDEQLLKDYLIKGKAVVSLFVNGYDPVLPEREDKIFPTSSYWKGMDERFNERLEPDYVFYADGNKSIATSNHHNVAKFLASMETSYAAKYPSHELINKGIETVNQFYYLYKANKNLQALRLCPIGLWRAYDGYGDASLVEKLNECFHTPSCVELNVEPNFAGFSEREGKGRAAGKAFVQTLRGLRLVDGDEINIVCHSMGFAYAQGIISELKASMSSGALPALVFNGYYIIAPENPSAGSVDASDWRQVWHYGTDEKEMKDTPWLQDGVAPQAPINGIDNNRVAIPNGVEQGFLESHSIGSYEWIFEQKTRGYVAPRK